MTEQIFYYFWSLSEGMLPYNVNQSYSNSTNANDDKFVDEFVYYRKYAGLYYLDYVYELMRLYLNVHYDSNNPEETQKKALLWINHTEDLLRASGENCNFLHDKSIQKRINSFTPSELINVNHIENNNPVITTYVRSANFFSQFGVTNTPINNTPASLTNGQKKLSKKVATVAINELLKLMEKGAKYNDNTTICKLIEALTGFSYNSIRNDTVKGISFSNIHHNEIDQINQIFEKLNLNIFIDKNKKY